MMSIVHFFSKYIACITLLFLGLSCNQKEVKIEKELVLENLTQYVDPFIGTGGHGHTYPGATVPFGMVQVSPNNGRAGWDWCSGYHYTDSIITGFTHLQLSGTGIGDLSDLLLMPVQRDEELNLGIFSQKGFDKEVVSYKSKFSHDDETASPGYYKVYLPDNGVTVELSSSLRSGIHQYTFDEDNEAHVVMDLGFNINWDSPHATKIEVVNDTLITGYRHSSGWAKDQRLFFAINFSKPLTKKHLLVDDVPSDKPTISGKVSKAIFHFGVLDNKQLKVKVAISSASINGAVAGLKDIKGWDFDQVKSKANETWNKQLNKIKVVSSDQRSKRIFYSALYHTQLAPMTFEDANGEYKGADSIIHSSDGFNKHTVFSLWDTFRAANPLYTIINPENVPDFINSLLTHYDEYGLLPVWELTGNETNTMTGYHAIPVITDAYLKGFKGIDGEKAYEAMKKSAMQDIRGVNFFKQYGYIPADLENESVTKNLEYAYDDWCIAQMAKALSKDEDYDYFMKRAASYRILFDPETKFMRGKFVDGSWKEPFDPKYSAHRVGAEYTEGNAWQHSWFVPHDVGGLIELMGGADGFGEHLDKLFTESSEITGDNVSVDISGLIGQYAHGNEPSHHIAYLYNYAGKPWKTQKIVKEIINTMYDDKPNGLSGNEDCGQMSAWYVFSSLGFYPVNPADGNYIIGSPVFDKSSIQLDGGKSFIVESKNLSNENIYIQGATLNGQILNNSYINHEQLIKGGKLVLEMGSKPNLEWATSSSSVPPSMFEN